MKSNAPFVVLAPEDQRKYRGVITKREVTAGKPGDRVRASNGSSYLTHYDGSLRRTSDRLTDFIYAEMGQTMNRNDHAAKLTGSDARALKRYKWLKKTWPDLNDKAARDASRSHLGYEKFCREEAKRRDYA